MKTVQIIIGVIILSLIVFGVYRAREKYKTETTKSIDVPVYKISKKDLIVKISETGKTESKNAIMISSPIEGKVLKTVAEGTEVKKGDLLVQFDAAELEKQSRDKLLSYQQALADIKQCEEQIAILRETARLNTKTKISQLQYDETELQIAKNNLSQQKRLYKEQIITKKEVEAAEATLRSKQSAVNRDQIDIEISRKTNDSDITKKEAELSLLQIKAQQAKLSLDIAQKDLAQSTIVSPGKGLVVLLEFWKGGEEQGKMAEGDQIRKGLPIISIINLDAIMINTRIREKDIDKIKKGMKAEIKTDMLGDKKFTAVINKITMVANESFWSSSSAPGQSAFPIELELEKNPGNIIKPGMNVTVNIILKKLSGVLTVPVESVFNNKSGSFVWIKNNQEFEKKTVKTGAENEDYVEIKEGLSEGEQVALRDPTKNPETPENETQTENKKTSKPSADNKEK